MLGYVMVGTNNLEKAAEFYDTLLAEIGAKRSMETDSYILWGTGQGGAGFCVTKPLDGNPASVGNGTMMAFFVPSHDMVDKLHALALKLGATDEGAPGPRPDPESTFYAAYFRDLDGNKMNFFNYPMPAK